MSGKQPSSCARLDRAKHAVRTEEARRVRKRKAVRQYNFSRDFLLHTFSASRRTTRAEQALSTTALPRLDRHPEARDPLAVTGFHPVFREPRDLLPLFLK